MPTIARTRVEVRKYGGYIGAIISGVDLTRPQDEEVYAQIRDAFDEHGVIFFYDQKVTTGQFVEFGRKMGKLTSSDGQPHYPEFPELHVVVKEAQQQMGIGDVWHVDQSFRPVPAKGTLLRAIEIPPFGGDTLFLSAAAAFDALPETMKDMLRCLRAVHYRPHIIKERQRQFAAQRHKDVSLSVDQSAIHPVVMRHPATGRECLFVNPGYTVQFEGWTQEDSAPLLNHLFAHCFQPEFHLRFRWSVNAITYWDNRQLWHYAANDYYGHRREMQRLIVE